MSAQQQSVRALLVGVDHYANPHISTLRGCFNDVAAIEQLLVSMFGASHEAILTLTDEQATHEAIMKSFREHLIDPARSWAESGKTRPEPAYLFHFSGHGSQAVDETGTEPDGLDETIVPYDSRTSDVYDIKDWELGELLAELTRYSDNVTVTLDCCHSGSGTRKAFEHTTLTRRCPPDLRPQPTRRPQPAFGVRGLQTASGWMPVDRYVLLAACRDREEANEYFRSTDGGGATYGALTHFLLQELAAMSSHRQLTYRELHERVRYQINSLYADQMPQCEGDRDRIVFGGVRPARDVFLTVVDKHGGLIWVDGGIAHGFTEGTRLHVYPPETRTLAEVRSPVARLVVEEVDAVKCGCLVEDGTRDVPIHSKVVVARLSTSSLRRGVALDIPIDSRREAVKNRLTAPDAAQYLDLANPGEPADFLICLKEERLEIRDATEKLLAEPVASDDLEGLVRDLSHMVRYYSAVNLKNVAPHSELANTVSVDVKLLGFDAETQQPVALPVETSEGGELVIDSGQRVVLEVTNSSDKPLYFAIFDFSYDLSIQQLYPRTRGAHEPLTPGNTFSLGLSRKRLEQLAPYLPPEVTEAAQVVKVIATVEATDFEVLEQGALKSPFTRQSPPSTEHGPRSALSQVLELAMDGGTRGTLGPPCGSTEDDWTTAQIEFQLTQSLEGKELSRRLEGGKSTDLPGYRLTLEPPEGFKGTVRVLTQRQSTRVSEGDPADSKPPNGLAGFGNLFEPVSLLSTRDGGPKGAVTEIDADDESRRRITPEDPLIMRLASGVSDVDTTLVALAYDGSFFYPVGTPGDEADCINVEWLPVSGPVDEKPLRSTRGFGRTVKLYLYRLLKWPESSLGLHRARFVPAEEISNDEIGADEFRREVPLGEVRYRKLRFGELEPGQRVALFVHGFQSDTYWMVGGLAQYLRGLGIHYDHVLAFDYESFNTPIRDNGKILSEALREAGLGTDDQIHVDIYAHSMGALVTRCMVELYGGAGFVDRCFFAGPPNLGTRLADAKGLVIWICTLALNLPKVSAPTLVASWALKRIADDAVAVEDLRPGSDLLQLINGLGTDLTLPYHILAGSNELPEDQAKIWQRLCRNMQHGVDTFLGFLFGGDHDLVVSVESMEGLRGVQLPDGSVESVRVPCDHFSYFSNETALEHLVKWLQGS